ncbi:hypothetical protein BGZ72_007645, partial [Mortierella alpina]
ILSGKKEVDVSKALRHECPAPKKGPTTKKRKRAQRAAIKKRQKIYKKAKKGDEDSERRTLQASTRRDHTFRSTYVCKTLKIGSVHGNLARCGSLDATEARIVAETIQDAAALLNKIQVCAYELIALDIASIISPDSVENTSNASSTSTPHLTSRQIKDLDDILESDAFYYSVATLLCQGSLGSNSQYARQLDAPPRTMGTRRTAAGTSRGSIEVPHAQRAFDRYKDASGFTPFFTRRSDHGRPGGPQVQSMTGGATFPAAAARLSLSSKNRLDPQFADFPKAKFAPGFVYLSEADMINILYSTPATRPIITKVMNGATKTAAEKDVIKNKGIFVKRLFYNIDSAKRLDGYHNKVSLQDDKSPTKFKLRGTICTNGLVLNLLAFDTTAPRKKSQDHPQLLEQSSSQGTFPRSSSQESGAGSEGGNDDLFQLQHDVDEDFVLDEAFLTAELDELDEASGEWGSQFEEEEEDEDEDSDKRPYSESGCMINWQRGSKLLRNIETVFVKPEDCLDARDSVVIGIDPGEIKTATATRIGPADGPTRASVHIRRSFLYRPYVKFRHLLQDRKAASGIDVLESKMPSMNLQGIRRYLDYLRNENRRETLFNFYLSRWYLKKDWDMRKAQEASYDYAIKAIMGLAGASEGSAKDDTKPSIVFAVGLGSFDSRTGLPSKHSALIRRLVIRVKSLGYGIYGVHEYFTSAKCPRKNCTSFLQAIPKSRSKFCTHCKAYFDRDQVGSENIGTICQMQMLHQHRPDKFKPAS